MTSQNVRLYQEHNRPGRHALQPERNSVMLPSPGNPRSAPIWENYVVAQTVQASLGLIPAHALAVGVEVDGAKVRLRFQLARISEPDLQDMMDIHDGLQDLVGESVEVSLRHDVMAQRAISPIDRVCWVYLARQDES